MYPIEKIKSLIIRRLFVLSAIFLMNLAGPMNLTGQEVEKVVDPPDSTNLIIHQLEKGVHAGQIRVVQDPRLTRMLRRHFEFNKTAGGSGWRILIYKGRDRIQAYNAQAEFLEYFSNLNLKVDIRYEEPDFLTVAGSFRTKEEAYRLRQMLISHFPNSYPVPERIFNE